MSKSVNMLRNLSKFKESNLCMTKPACSTFPKFYILKRSTEAEEKINNEISIVWNLYLRRLRLFHEFCVIHTRMKELNAIIRFPSNTLT